MKESKTILILSYARKLHEFSFLEDKYKFKLSTFYLGSWRDDDYIIYKQNKGKLQVSMWLHQNQILSCCIIIKRIFRKDIVISLREGSEKISNGKIKPDDFIAYIQYHKVWERWRELNPPTNREYVNVEEDYYTNFEENKANDTALYIELLKMYLDNIEK